MHYLLTDIEADFEINRPVRHQITVKRNYFHRRQTDNQTDRQTDRLTNVTYENNRYIFEKKNTKNTPKTKTFLSVTLSKSVFPPNHWYN